MKAWRTMAQIRREYGDLELNADSLCADPLDQFKLWFEDAAIVEKTDPTAMVLSTVDAKGAPDSRIVLLKGITDASFVFYTNYTSQKAEQLQHCAAAALNFYWPQMARQVRIRGQVKPTSAAQSDAYFASRPIESQLSAIISPQSSPIASRKSLEEKLAQLLKLRQTNPQATIDRPNTWGGYALSPVEMEFWQGRDQRLHDRFQYKKEHATGEWLVQRLAP